MNQRLILYTSIAAAVFVLATLTGIVSAVTSNQQKKAAVTNTESPRALTLEMQTQLAEREAAYNALISEANQKIQALSDQVKTLQQSSATAAPAITAEKAVEIALKTAGADETLEKMPELVSFQGKNAYEVTFNDGIVYISVQNGDVLFDGVPARIDAQKAGEIAGQYLGGMDPKYAVIKTDVVNGTTVYRVIFDGYIVYVDHFGNVIKAQVVQYSGSGSQTKQSGSGSTASASSGRESDNESSGD